MNVTWERLDNADNVNSNKIRKDNAASEGGESPLASFLYVLPNKKTQEDYLTRLDYFFDFLKITGSTVENQASKFLERAVNDHKWANDCLIKYINHLKNDIKRNLSGGSINNYYAPIRLFYESHTINLNWKWIGKGLPPANHIANDRSPSIDELRRLVEYPDRRIKTIVYVMASSGIRVDAWNYLRYKHITPPIFTPK